jgi:hypothetical protein
MDERDPMYDLMTAYVYRREAYGAPCAKHGTLTWGGDCPDCEAENDRRWVSSWDGIKAVDELG